MLETLSSKYLTGPETGLSLWAVSAFDQVVFLSFAQPSFPFQDAVVNTLKEADIFLCL